MSVAVYARSLVCCSCDVSAAFIPRLPPGRQKEPVFDVTPVFRHQRTLYSSAAHKRREPRRARGHLQ